MNDHRALTFQIIRTNTGKTLGTYLSVMLNVSILSNFRETTIIIVLFIFNQVTKKSHMAHIIILIIYILSASLMVAMLGTM